MPRRRSLIFALLLLVLWRPTPAAAELGPDNLLLLTNRNVPESRKLAEYYASKRHVPDGRIVELDLPAGDEIAFTDYEAKVIPAVRDFLTKHKLRDKVTCLVTFYGVPLRIANRVNSPADQLEVADLRRQLGVATDQVAKAVEGIEAVAREFDPAFKPVNERTVIALAARDRAARGVIARHASQIADPKLFDALMSRSEQVVAPLEGDAQRAERHMMALGRLGNQMTPAQLKEAQAIRDRLLEMRAKFDELQARRAEPEARAQLRNLVRDQLGAVEFARLVEGMIDYFATDDVAAALDSELAMLDWNYYPRRRSLPNPLHFKAANPRGNPPVYMVMRLDAPQAGIVQTMILASLKAETDALSGKVVIDAGGNLSIDPKNAAYAAFDRTLRNLAEIVRSKTRLQVVLDTNREVLPAESHITDVALYCGWYALRSYTPACSFAPGAVGYHIASFELTSLRRAGGREWCQGLLNDGIAATLGPVAEPYLSAFPPPDEFFPLLLTGKLTLAEVYWKTLPNTSWMITMIGDPLYTPFKAKPALELDALPAALQAVARPAPRPTTQAVR